MYYLFTKCNEFKKLEYIYLYCRIILSEGISASVHGQAYIMGKRVIGK